jgi:hypothetical protein
MTTTHDDKTQELMRLIGYSETDLAANRTGTLSGRQKRQIRKNARTALLMFGMAGLCFAVMIGMTGKQPLTEMSVIITGLIGGSFAAIGIALYWLQRRDYHQGIVKCLVGTVKVLPHNPGFALCVGDQQLPILYDLGGLVEENIAYKVYYAPSDRRLVSLEKA